MYIQANEVATAVSGHSTQLLNVTGTEEDGLDEGM